MDRKRLKPRKSKKVFCFTVEGCTERNYIQVIRKLYKRKVAFDPINPCGGGAKTVLLEAQRAILKDEHSGYVIWFDGDMDSPDNKQLKDQLTSHCRKNKTPLLILISIPCIENWLLCHFEKKSFDGICSNVERRLKRHIKGYEKNNCYQLEGCITKASIKKALTNYGKPKKFKVISNYFC
jgi:hypothetical protein